MSIKITFLCIESNLMVKSCSCYKNIYLGMDIPSYPEDRGHEESEREFRCK